MRFRTLVSSVRVASILSVALLLPHPGMGQEDSSAVRYTISFPNRVHHEAEVEVRFAHLPPGPVELWMSRASPGRYALHEFAKNVYKVRATGAGGADVPLHRPDPYRWIAEGHGGSLTVRYTLYADRADGTYSAVDETHAHLNVPATFMWARGLEDRPVVLEVRVPEGSGWRVATQLFPTDDARRFTAPDLQYFMDSPVEVSRHWTRRWTADDADIGVALHHLGSEAEADRFARDVALVVETAREVFGALPAFDGGSYTFLACYLPWASGDGMEHRNSTVLTSTSSLAENRLGLLGTVAHEFFHQWNVERIRPASLEPFDFTRANTSRELWFAEGFTSYYDDLILWRAGLIDDAAFARRVGRMADAVLRAPGRRYFSAVEMSMQAPFVDAATSIDPTNRANTFLSYYTWGSGIALALDLTLRTRYPGGTLDDLMRLMWSRFGAEERPYALEDLVSALAEVSGDDAFAREFFRRYVSGREAADYAALLRVAGIELRRSRPGAPWVDEPGVLRTTADGLLVTRTPTVDGPLYRAGLDRGDVIVRWAGRKVEGGSTPAELLRGLRPGEVVPVEFRGRGALRRTEVTLAADPRLEGVLAPGGAQREAFRQAWRAGGGA